MRFLTRTTRPAILGVAAIIAVLVLSLAVPRHVEAHASLVNSNPASGAELLAAPAFVEIVFSERIAPSQSEVRVLDVSGNRVDLGDTRPVDEVPVTLRVGLIPGLPDGPYTVSWQNLSDVDGHTQQGSFVFFVGTSGGLPVMPVETGGSESVPLGDALARWVTLAGLVLMAGAPAVFALVLAPATPAAEVAPVRRRIELAALGGGLAVLLAAAAQLGMMLAETPGGATSLVTDTRWGNAWALRALLTAAAVGGWWIGRDRVPARLRPALYVIPLAAAVTLSLASHGAAAGEFGLMAALVDAFHVLATVVWGGGLVAFLVLLVRARRGVEQRALLNATIPRFTVLGGLATFTLAVTGGYAAWLHVGSLDAFATDYGTGVVAKIVLLVALLAIAGINATWVRRRARRDREPGGATRWLRALVGTEVALIAAVLVATAVVTSISPARQQAAEAEQARGVVTETEEAGIEVVTTVNPGRIGPNTFTVKLRRDGAAYDRATAVEVSYRNLDVSLAAEQVALSRDAGGRWAAPGTIVLPVDGAYEFDVRVAREDGLDLRQTSRIETGAVRQTQEVNPARAWATGTAVLAVVGLALVAANFLGRRNGAVRGEGMAWLGAAVAAVALVLVARGPDASALGGAVSTDPAVIERGQALYVEHCARCHGDGLRGDGPDGGNLPVADLVFHAPFHPDEELFGVIADGRGAMPAWADVLSAEQIWEVLSYVRAETEP